MSQDQDLYDRLAALTPLEFSGHAYRATRLSLDALTFSSRGGRWSPDGGMSVLYTSRVPEGALAEINYHWRQLTPLPTKPARLHKLQVSTKRTLRLLRGDLPKVGIALETFEAEDYTRCQEVGAAVAFLGFDGLMAPNARWDCENLIIFSDNHSLQCELEVLESETVDWLGWGNRNGF